MSLLMASFFVFSTVSLARMVEREETTVIVIHHSATEQGDVDSFRRHHVGVNGWNDIGYHYVITKDGEIQPGRAEHLQGAHARTGRDFNRNPFSLGVVFVGHSEYNEEQLRSMVVLLADLCQRYKINPLDLSEKGGIQGHHEECPGVDLDILRSLTARLLIQKLF